jgi:large conductance mechanosensitive channel
MLKEFKAFAMRGNVVDLAIGVIIGAAFTTIVSSLVNDIITPPLGLALGGLDLSNLFVVLKGGSFATLAEAQKAGVVTLNYGLFLNAVLKFAIVVLALFLLINQLSRLAGAKPAATDAAPPPPPEDIQLLREIRDLLRDGKHPH